MAVVNAMTPNMARATTPLMEKKHLHTLEEGCMSVAASSHIKLSVKMRNQRMSARMAEEVGRQDASPKDAGAGIWVPSRGGRSAGISGSATVQSRRWDRTTVVSSSR